MGLYRVADEDNADRPRLVIKCYQTNLNKPLIKQVLDKLDNCIHSICIIHQNEGN